MKTARQRAKALFPHGPVEIVNAIELALKEYAKDQRHMCAEMTYQVGPYGNADDYHRAVMNTPFPGEE